MRRATFTKRGKDNGRGQVNRTHVLGMQEFEHRMMKILGLKSKSEVRESFTAKTQKGIRINRLLVKIAEEIGQIRSELVQRGIEVHSLSAYPDAFLVSADQIPAIMELPMAAEGRVFVQNPSSMLPVLALDPQPGDQYLDVCAAPGGKAAFFASLANGECELTLVDDNPLRVDKKMRPVLKNQKVIPKEMLIADSRRLLEQGKIKPESYDKILADVDCSSEGKINFQSSRPLEQWSLKTPEQYSSLQRKVLETAYKALKPGGILVYSTCTLAPEENEGVVSRFLGKNTDAIIQKVALESERTSPIIKHWPKLDMSPELEKALRVHPKSPYMEGFFLCRIYKPLPEGDAESLRGNKVKNGAARTMIVSLDELGVRHSLSLLG